MKKSSFAILGLLVTLSLFFSSLFIIVLVLRFWNSNNENEIEELKMSRYKYLKIDHNEKAHSYGFVTIPEGLGEDGFITYENDEGDTFIISDFGFQEYECSGTCYCNKERRTSRSAISRPLSIFVAAISSAFALQFAKTSFEETCVENFGEDGCESVKSEVSACSKVIEDDDDLDEISRKYQEELDRLANKPKPDEKGFLCYGNCMLRELEVAKMKDLKGIDPQYLDWYLKVKKPILDVTFSDDKCTNLELQKQINVKIPELQEGEDLLEYVNKYFTMNDLHEWCSAFSMCVGYNEEKDLNPTARCVKHIPVE